MSAQAHNEQISLSPGDARTEVKLKLIPSGSIVGRVLDGDGQPMESVDVAAMIDSNQYYGGTTTDEKGNFRLGGLPPGKYRLRAKPQSPPFPPEIRTDGTEEVHYRRTFYPNVPDEPSAAAVEVGPGAETGGIEIHLLRGRVVRVSGVVTGIPPASERVNITVQDGMAGFNSNALMKADGTFRIWRLDPGKYRITAHIFDTARTPLQSAPLEIEVGDSNIDNVALRMVPAGDVQGQLEYDDEQARPSAAPTSPAGTSPASTSGAQKKNAPIPARQVFLQGVSDGMSPSYAKIADDGSFTLERLQPDVYRVRVSWGGVYVKSMLFGQTPIEGSTLDLRNGPGGQALSIHLSSAVAKLSGIVRDGNNPAAGVLVALVSGDEGMYGFNRTASTDASGTYTISGIAPGTYKLVAIPSGNVAPLMRGKLPEEYAEKAESVSLAPSDEATKDLSLR
jgi:hypothetical protein